MTTETLSETEPPRKTVDSTESDPFFGFLAGLYAAALVAPAVAIGVAIEATADAGALFGALLGTTVAVVAGVGWVARRRSLAVRLGRTRWSWLAVVLPFGYAAVLAGTAGEASVPGAVGGISLAAMVVGLFVGLGLVAAAHNRHARAVLAEGRELVRFTAPMPERDRRLLKWTIGGMVAAGVLGLVASVLLTSEPLRWAFQLLIPAAAGLYGMANDREVVVSDAGLVTGTPVHKHVRPWSNFESYDVTDEAVVVRRAGWSMWGLRDVRRSLEDVDDPGAVTAALAEVLPRR